jgi:putative radical SAM enzyme (TIGR03279 family)
MANDSSTGATLPLTPGPSYEGWVRRIEPGSFAQALGLAPGDSVLAVNGRPVQDVIDVQFYAAEDQVEVVFRRDGQQHTARGRRTEGQPLGIEFTHPTFDIDIRRCNNLCPFCFVLQTAPRMRRTLYIKDDDYRYSFLYGHYVTLTNLSEHDWRRIEDQHLSPLYVSVHATDLKARRACLANPRAPDILAQLRWLAGCGITCHTQIVITPGLNDGPILEQSVRDLSGLYPAVASVSVVPVGLTRHHKYGHRPNTLAECRAVLDSVETWQAEFGPDLGVRFVYASDEWYLLTGRPLPPKTALDGLALEENGLGMVRGFLNAWRNEKRELKQRPASGPLNGRRATLVTGTLFAPVLAHAAREFNVLAGSRLAVTAVINQRLGETITVAGLLMGADVLAQLADRDLGEFVVLPRLMFDHPHGISLDDVSPLEIARALRRPVFLADLMGDVIDALSGQNPLRFHPDDPEIPLHVMRAGGWAVEKYL